MLHNLRTRGCKVCKVASGADIGNKRVVAILSGLGLEPGVTDYFVIVPGGHTVFLEMKVRQGGTLSAAQKRWHREARELDAAVVTGHGAKQACAEVERVALERWGVELPPVAQALQDEGA
jgi:hypothetical protein